MVFPIISPNHILFSILKFHSLVLWCYEILTSSQSLILISASSTHSRCRPQEIVSYSWVGNNNRVIIQLSPVRPFLFPSSSNGNAPQVVNCPVVPISPNSTQIQSNRPLFRTIPTKTTSYALSLPFSLSHSMTCPISPNKHPIQQLLSNSSCWITQCYSIATWTNNYPNSTLQIVRHYKIYAQISTCPDQNC